MSGESSSTFMEGRVYLCGWRKVGAGFKLWLANTPQLSVVSNTFDEAQEAIWEMICLKLGDGEAVLEFDPAPPIDSLLLGYQSPEIVSVSGNATVDAPRLTQGLFVNNYCPVCTRAWGERTNIELEVESLPTKSDGAVCMSIPAIGPIFSEAFLGLLSDIEKAQLRFLNVRSKKPHRDEFFELTGDPISGFVGLSGFPGFGGRGHPCEHCGYVPKSHLFKNEIYNFIASEDLPKAIPTIFAAGKQRVDLCMTAERWKQIRGSAAARNLVARPIYVIPNNKARLIIH